jgi:twitching motility two-component system response regulator PilH
MAGSGTEFGESRVVSGEREKRLVAIVDGDPAHLYYTSMVLQRLAYNIHTAKTAKEVIELLDVARPSLVLTEAVLPDMEGVELVRTIKRNPRTYAIPVMVLTAAKDPTVRDACLREGCKNYLQKPVEPEQLYAAIQKVTELTPRQYIRLSTSLNVMVGDDKAAELSVISDYITALSEQGMFINTSNPRPAGTEVPITILLEQHRVKVIGTVLYSFERGKGPLRTPGMGIRFISIKSEDQAVIKDFIHREITKGLTMGQLGGTVL